MTLLDSFIGVLDAETVGTLGDPITYTRAAVPGSPLSINAFVDHSDEIRPTLGGAAVDADVSVSVRKVDVALPASGDLVTLPQRAEQRRVTSWRQDASGRWWVLTVARV